MVDRKEKIVAAGNSALLLAAAGLVAWFTSRLPSALPAEFLLQAACILLTGSLTAALAAVHAGLAGAAAEEARDEAARPRETLFANEQDESGRMQESLRQFQKTMLPAALVAISLLEAGLAIWIARKLLVADRPPTPDAAAFLPAASALAIAAVLIFLPGKMTAGMAFGDRRNYLRPVAGATLLGAMVCAAAALFALLGYWGYLQAATMLAWLEIAVALGLALERVGLWLVDLYRPHAPGEVQLPVYESRVLALFSRPRGVLGNLSEIIEYQFGLRINDRMLATALQRVVLPLVLLQGLTLLALTCLVYIPPRQTGIVQQWGSPELRTLPPGLFVCLPWPAARVERVDTGTVFSIPIGALDGKSPDDAADAAPEQWSNDEFAGGFFLASPNRGEAGSTAPVSLMAVRLSMQYQILDPAAWVSRHRAPEALLLQLANRELSRILLTDTLDKHLGDGGATLASRLVTAIQSSADTEDLGCRIDGIRFRNLQPPPTISLAWEELLSAREYARRVKLEADRFSVTSAATTAYRASAIIEQARAETIRTRLTAEADSEVFASLRDTYREFPALLSTRAEMDALERALVDKRKIIIAAQPGRKVLELDLKKARPDLLDTIGTDE